MHNGTLYLGGDGYLGSYLKNISNGFINKLSFTSRRKSAQDIFFDILHIRPETFSICSKFETIIFGIANSSPEYCATNFDDAYKINVDATIEAINKFIDAGVKVLFLSSDVADPECGPLVGSYAYMKSLIEREFMDSKHFKVARLSYVFSRHDKFTKYLHYCSKHKIKAEVYDPFYRNIIHIDDVSKALMSIVRSWDLFGKPIYNLYGTKSISRVQMSEIFKSYHPQLEYSIVPTPIEFSDQRALCICPKYTDVEKLISRYPKEYSAIFTECL